MMNDITYYLYVLNGNFNIINLESFDGPNDDYFGVVFVSINVGDYGGSANQWLPISRAIPQIYMTSPANIVIPYGPASRYGISVKATPRIFKRGENNVLEEYEGTFRLSASDMVLDIYKLGGILANVQETGTVGGGSGTGGINNYNQLMNKPSINNVTLQGNLTTEQLGIETGSGNSGEMTYEEALAILNGEEEVSGT